MPERQWEQVKLLYEALISVDASQRLSLVKAIDPGVREELQSLLAVGDGFLETNAPGFDAVTELTMGTPPPLRDLDLDIGTPDRVGPYRILRSVGEGGMGVVYEAEQERPVRRKVALKLIKRGMDTKAVIGRFESERQALALMSHPNIAGVYDAGATEQGRPYFAMEYVQGIPITGYCDKHHLPIGKRLDLFVRVCEGVQHAHQKGIIHRDIKPSNVLVATQSGEPVPKIIDFGVAKATRQRLTEHSVHTELGQLIGTPEYMSPEQAEMTNFDIDTRTDVYSLGVLLFELLVGALPFDAEVQRARGFVEIQRRLREEDPPRPSVRLRALGDFAEAAASNRQVEVKALERRLRGDLDWIVLKALEKERTRRYGSAFELSADIQRHLRDEPVLARSPSKSYRLYKFMRRHRSAVIGAVAVASSLVVGTAVAIVQANRAHRAEKAATNRRQQADSLISFMVGDLREQLTAIGRLDVLDAAAEQSLRYFAAMDLSDVDAVSLGTYGEALRFIGLVRIDQGKPQEALVPFERARALAEELTHRDPESAAFWRHRSDAASDLGEAYWELKQEDRTLEYMSEAAEHLKRAIELDPNNEDYQHALAIGYNNLGAVNTRLRHLEPALDWFDQAAEATDRLLERKPDSPDYLTQKVESASWLGELYRLQGWFATAIEWHEEEIRARSRLLSQTGDPHHRARLADAYGQYGRTLAATGDHQSAVSKELEETSFYAALREHDPTNRVWRHTHEFGLAQLAEYELDLGEVVAARRRIEKSGAATLALLESEPSNVTWVEAQANVDIILARIALASDASESFAHAQRALARVAPLLTEDDVRPTVLRTYLRAAIVAAACRQRLGDPAESSSLATNALDLLTKWGNPAQSVFDAAYRVLLLKQLGRFDEARDLVERLSSVGFNEGLYRSLLEQ
jgi:eukaryotic-like serine/threonine-protein kinase